MFVVFNEGVHAIHVSFLFKGGTTTCKYQHYSERTLLTFPQITRETVHTLAPNSTRLAKFWTDLATSVRVLPAVEDGGSATIQNTDCNFAIQSKWDFMITFDLSLTSNNVEHSGIKDGWTDQSQKDKATERRTMDSKHR